MFKLTVLGSGTCIPEPHKNPSGYLLQTGKSRILIDSGSGTLRRLAEAGIELRTIDAVLYTHFHLDHFSDFPAILFSTIYGAKPRKNTLKLIGPKGLGKTYRTLQKVHGKSVTPETFKLEFKECSYTCFRLGELSVRTLLTEHTENSIGYRFESKGKVFVYPGDTPLSKGTLSLCKDADLLLIECSLPDGLEVAGHLTPSQVGEIASTAGVKKLLLTHLYPHQKEKKVMSAIQKKHPGRVNIARDLSIYSV